MPYLKDGSFAQLRPMEVFVTDLKVSLFAAVSGRLGLDAEESRTVAFLMEHHLLMSHTSQRWIKKTGL